MAPPHLLTDKTVDPPFRVEVDASFRSIGATELIIKGIALAERHHYVDATDGVLSRLVVVQLESFLPDNAHTYHYPLPDPISLGGRVWGQWVFGYRPEREDGGGPSAETADTLALLASHGLRFDGPQLMARIATILEPDARSERLVFYHEPLRAAGLDLDAFDSTGAPLAPALPAAREILQRAHQAASIT